jgi:hypothetical protein
LSSFGEVVELTSEMNIKMFYKTNEGLFNLPPISENDVSWDDWFVERTESLKLP